MSTAWLDVSRVRVKRGQRGFDDVHISLSYPSQGVSHLSSETLESSEGNMSPHKQLLPSVMAMTAKSRSTHIG